MREELKSKEVLAMYDIRGIQSYIFKSDPAKEIVGASAIVDNVIIDGLKEYKKDLPEKEYMLDWENDDAEAFLKDSSIKMQVMFIGGGNAYVLFREGSICEKVNKFLAKYVLENTYSLKLAVAVVEKTDSYKNDYALINEKMRQIKAYMPLSQPMGALPFMKNDPNTGYPLTFSDDANHTDFCTEARLKRKKNKEEIDSGREKRMILDDMVTEKGSDSTLAMCHIDGNSMGQFIRNIMKEKVDYDKAIPIMREISIGISKIFKSTFINMTKYMDKLSFKENLYHKIILAGDDITFVCNAKLAIPAVKYFLKNIGKEILKIDGVEKTFSACAGIAYFNSHFPFSDAYQVVEACCSSAKNRAKAKENRGENGKIENYFDFQICTNVRAANLSTYREKHYGAGEKSFIDRPYYVPIENDKNKDYSVEKLEKWLKLFNDENMPRSKSKQLRNVIPSGINEIEKEVAFLASRGHKEFEQALDEDKKVYRVWYDALEIMDLYIKEEVAENENKDNTSK